MGSQINFKSYGDPQLPEGGGRITGNFQLARQSSVYSMTFDEFQTAYTGPGKDLGSMNMDDLLKNICTAEETQGITSYPSTGGHAPSAGGNLLRQGSLTLPRTLSQKTVDEVWRDLLKENSGCGSSISPQRQQTFGEMTLEDFLAKAGVGREDTPQFGMPTNTGVFKELLQVNNNGVLASGLHVGGNKSLLDTQIMESNNTLPNQVPVLGQNVGVRSSQLQHQQQHLHEQKQQQKQQQQLQKQLQQHLFPKQPTVSFASPILTGNNAELASGGKEGTLLGISESFQKDNSVKGGELQGVRTGMGGLGAGAVTVAAVTPSGHVSSNVIEKCNVDISSLPPSPFSFSGGIRGRKGGVVEKVIERRQRRMIKNRESAARSRARKQAYTLELEAEIAKLKEMNEELQRKQEEIEEMHKHQIEETMYQEWRGKRRCLRRTVTGPW